MYSEPCFRSSWSSAWKSDLSTADPFLSVETMVFEFAEECHRARRCKVLDDFLPTTIVQRSAK